MKIISFNVNGIRAIKKKGELNNLIEKEAPDVLCVQETRIGGTETERVEIPGYVSEYTLGARAGYSGTAIFLREGVKYERTEVIFPVSQQNSDFIDQYGDTTNEGRITTLEFPDFYLVNVYTPNAKEDLSRLELRHEAWDPEYLRYISTLREKKPVITCGDFNAAHEEIDIARPEANHNHAGFTDEEREGVSRMINSGMVDSFRVIHPLTVKYSWWTYRGGARKRNIGWRIDYFFVDERLMPRVAKADVLDLYLGSDHAPVMIEVEDA